MQSQRREESRNIPLDYCSLLIELGIPQILSIKTEITRETPEVQKFFFKLGSDRIRQRLKTVYGATIRKEKGGFLNGEIRFLNRFLQGVNLKLLHSKKPFVYESHYRIISNDFETLEDIRAVIDTGDKEKIKATFLKRFNYEKLPFGKKPGVYKILCVPTGDFYIGASGHIPDRIQAHKALLSSKKLSHHAQKLQELWDTHGKHNFEFSVLEYTILHQDRERYFIKEQKPSLNTKLLPIEQSSTRIKVLPEIKDRLMCLSNNLEIDIDELVHKLLINELEALTK